MAEAEVLVEEWEWAEVLAEELAEDEDGDLAEVLAAEVVFD
jgi:hypothetical protein